MWKVKRAGTESSLRKLLAEVVLPTHTLLARIALKSS